jgi:hypothetical protein
MKRQLVPVFALALLLAAVPAHASDFSLFGSWADTDALGDSYGGGAKLDFTFGGTVGLEFRGTYYPDLGEDFGELIDDDDPVFDFEAEAIPVDVGVTLQFGSGKNFFISGGGTYWFLDSNLGEIDDEVGWYAAAGFKSGNPAGGVGFFVEGIYRDVDGTVDTDLDEIDDIDDIDDIDRAEHVGLDLSGVGVNAGVVFRF